MDPDKEILLALGRLAGKVDALISQHQRIQSDVGDLDKRIRTLEGSKAFLVGACGVVATAASYLVSLLN